MADLYAPEGTGACIAKAGCLGYAPVNSIVWQLWTAECLLMVLPTGVAQDMMLNVSSKLPVDGVYGVMTPHMSLSESHI